VAQTVPESAPDTEPKTGNRVLSSEQIFEKMREVLAVEFEILGDSVRPDAHLVDDLDLDSLDVISLLQELGDVIGVGLDEDDVRECKTLADLAGRISIRLAGES
jgi:acyl carrier protein